MEKLKALFSNTKKTVVVALIMHTILIVTLYLLYRPFSLGIRFLVCLENAGILIYFIILTFRLYQKKGNIKIANYILIIYFIVRTIFLLMNVFSISSLSFYDIVFNFIIPIIVFVFCTLYFCKILFKVKVPLIDNMIFTAAILIYVSNTLIGNFNIYSIIFAISYLSIIPYFYNYYELLERRQKNDK